MARDLKTATLDDSGSIAAAIAHEVNNLLTPVIGLADLLEHTSGDDAVRDQLVERAVERCQRAVAICGLLVGMAKQAPTEPASCEVAAMLERVLATAAPKAEEARIRLELGFEELGRVAVPQTVAEHIVLNLVLNAIAASSESSTVSLTARYSPASQWRPASWVLTIADRGCGLDVRSVLAVNEGGLPVGSSGIGLAVVRLLCERWGGKLTVESQLGAGTTFHVKLPAA